jgi:hypothetical protein
LILNIDSAIELGNYNSLAESGFNPFSGNSCFWQQPIKL